MRQTLTVVYDGGWTDEIDKALEDALRPLGFERWASGFNFVDGERDLAFEREVEDD